MKPRFAVPLTTALALLASMLSMAYASKPASAAPAQPPTDYSWYVTTQSISTIYQLGCNQGRFDTTNNANSFVYIDYGAQNNSNTATISPFQNNVSASYLTDANMAAQFALGYYQCSGTTTVLSLILGTSNCNATNTNFGGGQGWGNTAVQANNEVNGPGQFDASGRQINVYGGSDIESWYGIPSCPNISPNQAIAWVQGFAANAQGLGMVDYGDAAGCYISCNGGWSLYDYWYLAYGYGPDQVAPQIYSSGAAADWGAVSSYGSTAQGLPISFMAVQDENDRKPSTDSPTQAWNDFWTAMSNYGVAGYAGSPASTEVWLES